MTMIIEVGCSRLNHKGKNRGTMTRNRASMNIDFETKTAFTHLEIKAVS